LGNPKEVVVERNGVQTIVAVQKYKDESAIDKVEKYRRALVEPRFPFEIIEVGNKGLLKVGMLKTGEKVLSVNDRSITYYDEFKNALVENAGKKVTLKTIRNNKTIVNYKVTIPEDGKLGVIIKLPSEYLSYARIEYNPIEAIPAGIKMTFKKLSGYVKGMGLLFDTDVKGYKYLGGFGSMASSTPREFSMENFLVFTAVISIILAFMNFLPIPMLDGGYVVFILYEMITRREPSERFMEIVNYFGMIFLLGLMLYANGNDIYRAFFK
jgi:regulator of sigma E protease